MNILDRYIVRRILAMTALVMAVIIALAVLFTFINEQGDTGTGHYGSLDAFWFALMSVPQQAWELMPIGALIGSLLGLGSLASGSELTVARAAGVSVGRLAVSVFIAGLALVGVEVVLGELLAPPLQQVARQQKAFERFSDASFGGGSAWVRDGNQILGVEQSQDGEVHGGMLIFELSSDHHLLAVGRAARALPGTDHHWVLRGYAESRFTGDQIKASSQGVRTLDSNVSGEFLRPGHVGTRRVGQQRAVEPDRLLPGQLPGSRSPTCSRSGHASRAPAPSPLRYCWQFPSCWVRCAPRVPARVC